MQQSMVPKIRELTTARLISVVIGISLSMFPLVSTQAQIVLEEITVTATKREENVQDVPIAMSVMSQEVIDDMRAGGGDREVFGTEQKRHPADFALWKFSKPDEPSWSSPCAR